MLQQAGPPDSQPITSPATGPAPSPAPEGRLRGSRQNPGRGLTHLPHDPRFSAHLAGPVFPPVGPQGARRSPQVKSKKIPPAPQRRGAEPRSARRAFLFRGLHGNARPALLGPAEDSSLLSSATNPEKLDRSHPCLFAGNCCHVENR